MDVSDEHQYWFSPFGVRVGAGVLFAVVLSLVAITYAASYVIGERIARLVFVGGLGFLVLAPGLYSGVRSPFEERRKLVSSFAGGGFFSTPPDAWFPESVGFMRILITNNDGISAPRPLIRPQTVCHCCHKVGHDAMLAGCADVARQRWVSYASAAAIWKGNGDVKGAVGVFLSRDERRAIRPIARD